MLMSSDNDDPGDRGFKSVWILEGDWHGTNHSNDPRFCVAWRRHTFSVQCHWVWGVVTVVLPSISWYISPYQKIITLLKIEKQNQQ